MAAIIAEPMTLALIAWFAFVNRRFVQILFKIPWVVSMAFLGLDIASDMLQLLVALWVALSSFPFAPSPLQLFLVVFVTMANFRFVKKPLRLLFSLLPRSRVVFPMPICIYGDPGAIASPITPPPVDFYSPVSQFIGLPTEVRRMIWSMALPNRIVELNIPEFAVRSDDCTFVWTSMVSNKAPLISQVCREARDVALKYCNHKSDKQRAMDLALRPCPPQTPHAGPMPIGLIWSDSQHPLVKPDENMLWFNAARDIVILYHSLHWEKKSDWASLLPRIALYGYLAADRAVFASNWNPWPRCMQHFYQHTLSSGPIIPWADPIFILRIVVIHASEEEARTSGLFGLLGDEYIQLVDPWDTNLMMEFFYLTRASYHEQGASTNSFFESLRANVGQWEAQIQAWRRDAMTRELWIRWIQEYSRGFAELDYPEDVFLGPRSRDGKDLDMRNPASYGSLQKASPIDLDEYGPNEDHPWVTAVLASLPTFCIRIQFRHCAIHCSGQLDEVTEA